VRRGLLGEGEFELVKNELQVFFWVRVAGHDDLPPVAGGEMRVEHLQGRKLLQCAPGCESFGAAFEPRFEGDLQRVGEEGDKNVRFDSVIELMMNGADGEIVLHLFEGLLHLGEPSAGGRREIGRRQAGRSPTEPEEAKEPTGGSIPTVSRALHGSCWCSKGSGLRVAKLRAASCDPVRN